MAKLGLFYSYVPITISDALNSFYLAIGWWPNNLIKTLNENATWIKICIFLFVVLEVANFVFFRWFKYYLKTKGPIYKSILRINERYSFFPLSTEYRFYPPFNSVSQLRNFDLNRYISREVNNSSSQLHGIVNSARINRLRYISYIDDLSQIDAEYVTSSWGRIARFILLNYEKEIYKKLQLNPVKDPVYYFELNYTSPAGRNSYSKTIEVKQSYFERIYNTLFPKKSQISNIAYPNQYTFSNTADIQFNKSTPGYSYNQSLSSVKTTSPPKKTVSATPQTDKPIDIKPGLRYEIMERDRGKCTVCGRSRKDNVKLEVMPVRIYGPLTEKNLHTICNECFAEEQRSLCTEKVKNAVKRRDGYTCRICGNTEADGYMLHVDHRRPIARWGMSTQDNLWTLCQNCNLGKGKKYNPIDVD